MSLSEISAVSPRSAIGKVANEEGHSFERRVADVYRLMHYEVEHGRLFGGRQVDLFLTGDFGDIVLNRAIECKLGAVRSEHVDSFLAKLRLVRRDYPSALGTIVSAVSFTDAVSAQAAEEGLQLVLFRDLIAKLLDGHGYARSLKAEIESNTRYPIAYYIEPLISYDSTGAALPAMEVVNAWLRTSDWHQLTLLGDAGTGKSFLCRMIARRLTDAYLADPVNQPLPILIDLRNADREFSLEGIILTHFARNGLRKVSYDAFQHSLSEGNAILIFDGFDEMSVRVSPQVSQRNFVELASCIKGRAKVLLTCRTHYFKSRSEEEEVILGSSSDYGSDTSAKELYWELISRSGFRIAYLRPFILTQIEEYVSRVRPKSARQDLHKIRSTYNLLELSQRPMLLDMIVKSLDKIAINAVNPATLYTVYTDAWIHRDKWRDALSPESKLQFLIALARMLWITDAVVVHHTELFEFVRQQLGHEIQNAQHLVEIDSEVRTATFLTRDAAGNYAFAHKSYAEFFLARFVADRLIAGDTTCLNIRRLTPEVVSFLRHMVELPKVEALLEELLCREYLPSVSENALVCLYGFRRSQQLESDFVATDSFSSRRVILQVKLPENIQLMGAQLGQVVLEGATLIAADFSNAILDQAILSAANLQDANFQDTTLVLADLSNSNCSGAKFRGADLSGCNLSRSTLVAADLEEAELHDAFFAGAILDPHWAQDIQEDKVDSELKLSGGVLEFPVWLTNLLSEVEPRLIKLARVLGHPRYLEPQDIPSLVLIQLGQPKRQRIIEKLGEFSRQAYIVGMTMDLLEQINTGNEDEDEYELYRSEMDEEPNPWLEYDYLEGTWSDYYYEAKLSDDYYFDPYEDEYYWWDEEEYYYYYSDYDYTDYTEEDHEDNYLESENYVGDYIEDIDAEWDQFEYD